MRWSLLGLLGLACEPTINLARVGDAPEASILSPSDGSEVPSGRLELLGRVSDAVDPAERLYAVWSIASEDGVFRDVCQAFADSDGLTLCVAEVSPEDARVRLLVKDVPGFEGQAFADLVVRAVEPPHIELLAPDPVGPFHANVLVPLEAVVVDPDGGPRPSLRVVWQSDVLGRLDGPVDPDAEGRLRGAVSLPEGEHRITLLVTDADEATAVAAATVFIRADNAAPVVRVDAPWNGQGIEVGHAVDLIATVRDDVTPVSALEVAWTSDLDGDLGGALPDAAGRAMLEQIVLSEGDHRLTATSTDGSAFVGNDAVTVHVDAPPDLTVVEPVDPAFVLAGQSVIFEVSVTDAASSPEQLRVSARSDLTGALFTDRVPEASGTVRVGVPMSPGAHTVQITAVDGFGLTRTVTVHVTVS